MVYGLRSDVMPLVHKRGPMTSHWFRRGDQWQVLIQKGGSVTFMIQRGTIGDWTKSVTYLLCPNWYHMHIELRSWCITHIYTLWSCYYGNWCIIGNDIHVIGDCLNYTIIYYLCTITLLNVFSPLVILFVVLCTLVVHMLRQMSNSCYWDKEWHWGLFIYLQFFELFSFGVALICNTRDWLLCYMLCFWRCLTYFI